jgi:hypothetical protein
VLLLLQGVGKGHVLNWLSAQKLFPLEYIVHVDPDFFKSIMPEWTRYRDLDEEQAGSFCHAGTGAPGRAGSTGRVMRDACHTDTKHRCCLLLLLSVHA